MPDWTPGHWSMVEGANNDPEWPDLRVVGDGRDLFFVEDAGYEEARLAAAAPDLYDALERVMTQVEAPGNGSEYNALEYLHAKDAARQALAKARGERDA